MTLDELDQSLTAEVLEKCPLCGGSVQIDAVAQEVEYAPPYQVRGRSLPKMTRWVTMIICNSCEYAETMK